MLEGCLLWVSAQSFGPNSKAFTSFGVKVRTKLRFKWFSLSTKLKRSLVGTRWAWGTLSTQVGHVVPSTLTTQILIKTKIEVGYGYPSLLVHPEYDRWAEVCSMLVGSSHSSLMCTLLMYSQDPSLINRFPIIRKNKTQGSPNIFTELSKSLQHARRMNPKPSMGKPR